VLLVALAGGGYFAIEGAMSVGGLVVTYFYLSRALGPIRSANSVVFGWQRTTAALTRIDDILHAAQSLESGNLADSPSLSLDAVAFAGADTPTLTDVNLKLGPGQRIAIVAPSGAGKSTAARLILGLLEPDEGNATFGEQRMHAVRDAASLGIAYLGQQPFLFSGTLRENVDFGRELPHDELERACRIARVEPFAGSRGGLEMTITEAGRNLSGGQQKRVALARALAARPALLVIDQLATDLEADLVAEIFSELQADSSTTVLYFGHAVPPALNPNAVYHLSNGRLVPQLEERDVLASG
jgi:ABC-type bacteriocin/lantibiotic exporter with double-glycine peptidase domain